MTRVDKSSVHAASPAGAARTILGSRWIIPLLTFLILAGCGGDSGKSGGKLPAGLRLEDYYPFKDNSYWSYEWKDSRGDRWHGSLTVTDLHKSRSLTVFTVTDTTRKYGDIEVSHSGYLWDAEGLKHLYRALSNGDSAVFRPPRIVLPARTDGDKTYRQNYNYDVLAPDGGVRLSAGASQQQKLSAAGTVKAPNKQWKDCIQVETVRTDTYTNGTTSKIRQVVWYSREVGPVKVLTGIPPESPKLVGDITGILTATH